MSRKLPDRAWVRRRVVHGKERWQVVTVINGSRATRVYASRKEALRECDKAKALLKTNQLDAPATWEQAVEAFLEDRKRPAKRRPGGARPATLDSYRRALETVGRVLDDPDPLALSAHDAERYLELRKAEGVRPATMVAELEAVTILQRWLVSRGWLRAATWASVPRPEIVSSKRALRPDEVGRFLRAADRLGADPTLGGERPGRRASDWRTWPAAAWLLMHGLRTSEAQHLLVGDLDLVTGHVHIEDREGARTKSRASSRIVPILAEPALEILRSTYRDAPTDAPCFAIHTRGPRTYPRTQWFARRCAITCDLAGIERVSPHELRHTVATAAIVAGADVHSISALVGHADARMLVRTYSHATAAERAQGAAVAVSGYLTRVYEAAPVMRLVR